MEKTALQQLKEKLQTVVDDLKDAIPGTDQYGYRDAMRNVILDIDMQMIPAERDAIVEAAAYGNGRASVDDKKELGEQYYRTKYGETDH
jgi:hypothetical protein